MTRILLLIAVISVAVPLAGCGYKGPLYLKPKPEGRAAPALVQPEPAPDRPVPAESAPAPK